MRVQSSTWYVYMVQCSDQSLYTGVAKDVPQRVVTHNTGKGAKYTRSRLPVVLVYQEPASDRGTAQKREHEIKQLTRIQKQELINPSYHSIT